MSEKIGVKKKKAPRSLRYISNMEVWFFALSFILLPSQNSAYGAGEIFSGEVFYSGFQNCGSSGADCLGYVTKQISANEDHDKLPQINNHGDVVWQGKSLSPDDYEIYFWSKATGQTVQVTNNQYDDTDPRISDLGGITWMGFDGHDWEIYFYENGSIRQLTDNEIEDKYPKINKKNEVVWIAGAEGADKKISNYEMYLFDGNISAPVTANGAFNVQPRISEDSVLMWRGKGEESFDIFVRENGTNTQVTHDSLLEVNPHITSGGIMTWERNDGDDDEIMVQLGRNVESVQITSNTENDCYPQINASGKVVWQGYDGNDWEIYMFDEGSIIRLTDNQTQDFHPLINSIGDVSWLSKEGDGTGVYIFKYSVKTISKISEVFTGHYRPVQGMNDDGELVWSGSDGSDFEITVASPK